MDELSQFPKKWIFFGKSSRVPGFLSKPSRARKSSLEFLEFPGVPWAIPARSRCCSWFFSGLCLWLMITQGAAPCAEPSLAPPRPCPPARLLSSLRKKTNKTTNWDNNLCSLLPVGFYPVKFQCELWSFCAGNRGVLRDFAAGIAEE